MHTERRYSKTAFTPADTSYGPVTITDGAGKLIRTISKDVLHARALAAEKHERHMAASLIPRGIEFPTAGKIKAKGRRY